MTAATCRGCGTGRLDVVLDLGAMPLANALVGPDDLDRPEARFPLALAFCPYCKEVQITVFGDPAKPGLYAIRRRFKPGEMSRPHDHDKDRLVTVIKGTWFTGEGDVFDPAKTTAVKTGGFMFHPANFHHWDGAKDEEVIVQIIGMGPVQTVNTEKK